MPTSKNRIKILKEFTAEGKAMNAAFKKATKKARKDAFAVRQTLMVEKNGWLVLIDRTGKVVKRVKQLEQVRVPAR